MVRLGVLRPMHGEVSKTGWVRIGYAVFRPLMPLVRYGANKPFACSSLRPSVVISRLSASS